MGAVLPFPVGALRTPATLVVTGPSDAAIAREARMSARAAGCNGAQAALVGAHAEGLLRTGMSRKRVLAACVAYSEALRNPPPDGPVAA